MIGLHFNKPFLNLKMYLTPYYTEHTAKSQHEQLLSTVPCDWGLGLLLLSIQECCSRSASQGKKNKTSQHEPWLAYCFCTIPKS